MQLPEYYHRIAMMSPEELLVEQQELDSNQEVMAEKAMPGTNGATHSC